MTCDLCDECSVVRAARGQHTGWSTNRAEHRASLQSLHKGALSRVRNPRNKFDDGRSPAEKSYAVKRHVELAPVDC